MTKGKSTPETTRLRALLDRALVELRLADDLARAREDKSVSALIGGAKRNLRICLSRVEGRSQTEVK